MGVGDSLLLLSLSWKPILLLWRIWPCVTQTRKSVSMWFADPQQPIKSNNAKVPLLVTLQHSNQNQLWTGLIRQRHCTPNQKFIIIMGGKHKSLTISFLLQKCGISATLQKPKIWYGANDLVDNFDIHSLFRRSSLVLRQRSGWLFRYSLVISF